MNVWATIRTSLTDFGFFYIYISAKNLLPTAENLWKRKIQCVSCGLCRSRRSAEWGQKVGLLSLNTENDCKEIADLVTVVDK